MKKSLPTMIAILLLQFSSMMFGQEEVKLFNNTGNKEIFSETYYYDVATNYTSNNFHSSDGSLYRAFRKDVDPFWKDSNTTTKQEGQITHNLSEFLIHRDSVQMQVTLADSLSPILILQFLKDELEVQGIKAYYPSKGKQPADYLAEISSCKCYYQLNSLQVNKKRYTGNYRVEYIVKWKEKDAQKTFPAESETKEHIIYEWERKHKAEMDEIPNLSTSMTMLCHKIAKAKAKQIISALKKGS